MLNATREVHWRQGCCGHVFESGVALVALASQALVPLMKKKGLNVNAEGHVDFLTRED